MILRCLFREIRPVGHSCPPFIAFFFAVFIFGFAGWGGVAWGRSVHHDHSADVRPSCSPDSPPVAFSPHKKVLPNGLTVLVTELPSSSTVSVYALVKTGSALEDAYLGSGISHIMEHMLFKGTERRGVGEISAAVQALGGRINASTSFDYTIYTIDVPHERFREALDILTDMLMNSVFDAAELDKEREVVYGEMRMRDDRPPLYHGQQVYSTVYRVHPYGVPVIGHESFARQLTRDDFVTYYQKRYIPNNIILSVAGRVNVNAAMDEIERAWSSFSRGAEVRRMVPQEPEQVAPRIREEFYPTPFTRLTLAYPGVDLFSADMPALDVLAMLLGQGKSSRLYQRIVEPGLAQSVQTYNSTPVDRGFFEISAVLEDERLEDVTAAIREEIGALQKQGVRPQELKKAKRQVIADYVFSHQSAGSIAYGTALDEAFVGDPAFSLHYVDKIQGVEARDVQEVARRYLVSEKENLVLLRPQAREKAVTEERASPEESLIQRFELSNGVTLLVREDRSLPVVSIVAVAHGGTRLETPEKNGVSELASRVWIRETRRFPQGRLAEAFERRGSRLSSFSGRNSIGIQMSCLPSETKFALSVLEDLVDAPVVNESDVEWAKARQIRDVLAQQDSIFHHSFQILLETLFQRHPFRLNPLGTVASVSNLNANDVRSFLSRILTGPNLVIAVYGDIQAEEVKSFFDRQWQSLPQDAVPLNDQEPLPLSERRVKEITMPKTQAMISFGFQAPALGDEDVPAVEVLAGILGSPFRGRIFDTIRDQYGQAYTLGGQYQGHTTAGLLFFFVQTTDDQIGQVRRLLEDIFTTIREQGVSDEELNDIKTYLKGRKKLGLETNGALAFQTSLDELYGLGYDEYNRYDKKIDGVTAEDVKSAAKKYLDLNKAAVVITHSQNPKRTEGQESAPRDP